ncbi:MAG: sporulation protein, partial [Chloroflexota bacterium]
MSTMKKLLAAIGIGAAKVETELDRSHYTPGDTIHATVTVTGGQVPQTLDNIYLHVIGRCRYVDDGKIKYATVNFGKNLLVGKST